MHRRITVAASFAAAALSLTALSGCGSAEAEARAEGPTVSITDAQGRQVTVPQNPEVVVAADWGVVRTLTDLGIDVDAVPSSKTPLPEDLAKYARGVKTIGTVKELDYEAINALNPDLVIVAERSGTPQVVEEVSKFATVIDMSARWEKPSEQLPMMEQRAGEIGKIFNKESEAKASIAAAREKIAAAKAKVAESKRNALFIQVSGGKANAFGPGSRFGIIHEEFGFADTGAPIDPKADHGQEISQEFLAQYNPDVLFVLDRAKTIGNDETPALDVLNNGLVGGTTAAAEERIVEIDGFSWYIAPNSARSLETMAADITKAL